MEKIKENRGIIMRNKITLIGFLFIMLLLISSCNSKGYKTTVDSKTILNEVKKITAEQLSINESEEGTSYTFRVVNDSHYLIKQNVVYFSYPILLENGSKQSPFKIEATGNKLDIKPGEEVILEVFVPKEIHQNIESIVSERPMLEMKGFLNEVNYNNMFHMYNIMKSHNL